MSSACMILLKASCPSFSLISFPGHVGWIDPFIFFSFLPSFIFLCPFSSLSLSISLILSHTQRHIHIHMHTSLALSSKPSLDFFISDIMFFFSEVPFLFPECSFLIASCSHSMCAVYAVISEYIGVCICKKFSSPSNLGFLVFSFSVCSFFLFICCSLCLLGYRLSSDVWQSLFANSYLRVRDEKTALEALRTYVELVD